MPFSVSSQLSTVVGYAERLAPQSVLDIGTGMGQYGLLLRNSLESVNLFEIHDNIGWQRPRSEWRIRIDGIEGFAGYITPVHDYSYSNMIICDAIRALKNISSNSYDLVLAVDIIEHFDKVDALVFIDECQRVCSKGLLIATPREFIVQGVPANPLENHRSHWTEDDFRGFGFSEFLSDDFSIIATFKSFQLNMIRDTTLALF